MKFCKNILKPKSSEYFNSYFSRNFKLKKNKYLTLNFHCFYFMCIYQYAPYTHARARTYVSGGWRGHHFSVFVADIVKKARLSQPSTSFGSLSEATTLNSICGGHIDLAGDCRPRNSEAKFSQIVTRLHCQQLHTTNG